MPSLPTLRRHLGLALLVVLLAAPSAARAMPFDWNVRAEPGLAIPLTDPQATRFGVGGGLALKGGLAFIKWVDVNLAVHYLGFSGKMGDGSSSLGVGGGARVKWRSQLFVSPWVDLDLLYVRTGSLDRFGLAVAAGASFGLGSQRALWIGPFVRYFHVFQPDEAGFDGADAKVLILGASIEFGTPHPVANPNLDSDFDGIPDKQDACPREAEDKDGFEDGDGCPELDNDKDGVLDDKDKCPMEPGTRDAQGCPDRDKDGVADTRDKCPDAAGPADNDGCPKYSAVTVTGEKLELKDKIFFAYDKTEILPKSFDILNEVVQVLKDKPELKVRIEGHTDDRGSPKHNTELSQGRAQAVRDYLIANGISADRLEAKGYGASQPLESNKTNEGRERNRRVEFVIIK